MKKVGGNVNRESFWHIRAEKYDKLFWVRDRSYIDFIVENADFEINDYVLDVGTGTGVMARAVKPHVGHVVGLDISGSMLEKGSWEGISILKWDISESLFADGVFDKIMARMCFHHVVGGLDQAIQHCFRALKEGGVLIVAEGIPPANDESVVSWYAEMFRLKEERLVFTRDSLVSALERNGFRNVRSLIHVTRGFSVNNWLENSGIDEVRSERIIDMHVHASDEIKAAYNMKVINMDEGSVKGRVDCLIDTVNAVCIGYKR